LCDRKQSDKMLCRKQHAQCCKLSRVHLLYKSIQTNFVLNCGLI
jgi:hypothetical protein